MAEGDRASGEPTTKGTPGKTAPVAKTSDRGWLPLATFAALFAVVIVLATTALLLSPRPARSPEPSLGPWPQPVSSHWCAASFSPDEAVEDWAKAVEVGDYGGADACLSSSLLAGGLTSKSAAEKGRLIDLLVVDWVMDTSSGAAAVSVQTAYEGPNGLVNNESTVRVVNENEQWRLDNLPDPGI
jgi:hypothetical protein